MSISHIIQDETGIYVVTTDGKRDYLVPEQIIADGEIVYRFDTSTRVLQASIGPKALETILEKEGWEQGKDVRLPNPNARYDQYSFLTFPNVQKVEPSQFGNTGFYYDRLKHPKEFGWPAIKRDIVAVKRALLGDPK